MPRVGPVTSFGYEGETVLLARITPPANLAEGKPVRALQLSDPNQMKILRGLSFMTAKRVLYVANVDEGDVLGKGDLVTRVRKRAEEEGGAVVPVCAKIESELAELDGADQKEMLESLGLTEPALASLEWTAY